MDLRNVGFGVVGTQLRYNTGFAGTACTVYPLTAGITAENASVENSLSDGDNVVAPGVSWASDFTSALREAVPAGTACSNAAFTAMSFGSPKNTFDTVNVDQLTINERKILGNPQPGL
jgi:hypothetical protein